MERDQVSAGVDPVRQRRHLPGGQRHVSQDDDVVEVQHGGVMNETSSVLNSFTLTSEDLARVARELVGGGGDDEDRRGGGSS